MQAARDIVEAVGRTAEMSVSAKSLSMDLLAMHMTLSSIAREDSQQSRGQAPHRPETPRMLSCFYVFLCAYLLLWRCRSPI